jgi:hypothetical protein
MKTKTLTLCLALVCVAGAADAAVTFTITPSAVSNTYSGQITLQVAGLATGGSVVVQKFLDLNTNGVIDGTDWLVQQFTVTDGQAGMEIGGIFNSNVPGDTDTVAGQITVKQNFQGGDFMQNIVGKFLYKVSGNFTPPITNVFTVTNFAWAQKFTGNVVSNGTSTLVSNAVVLLFPPPGGKSGKGGPSGSPLGGAVANNAGVYTIKAPAGTYMPAAFRSNYMVNFSTTPVVTLGAGATVTTNLALTNTTTIISGTLLDAATSSLKLPGVLVPVMSTNGFLAVGCTDTNGNFNVRVQAGQYSVNPNASGMIVHGYLGPQDGTNVSAGTTGVNIAMPKITALIYGSVKDVLGNPMPGIDIYVQPGPTNLYGGVDGFTDTNGYYVAGVAAVTNETWWPEIDTEYENPGLTNYIFTQFTNAVFNQSNGNVASNTAVQQNFTGMLVTNHISGSVKINGTNIVGVGVAASQNIGAAYFWTWTHTDTNGNYILNVGNGTWDVSVYCAASGYGDDLDTILGVGTYVPPADQWPIIANNNAMVNFAVQGCGGLSITTASTLPVGEVSAFYDQFIQASSCNASLTWSQTGGSLPGNVNLNQNGNAYELSGTPNASGTYAFTVQVNDGTHTTNQQFSVSISNAVQVTTTTLPNSTNGAAYSQTLQATGGVPFGGASRYSWTVAAGSLPANLTLATNGWISGTLATNGLFNFTAAAADTLGMVSDQPLSLTIISTNGVAPPVNIAAAGGQMLVFYPLSGSNYVLQTTTNLATGPWVPATNGVSVTAFTFTNNAPATFFRLH